MRHELPKAKMLRTGDVQTTWQIDFPLGGKSYYATTYPSSTSIFLETTATRRPVSSLVARKIMPQVREAIEKAGWKFGAATTTSKDTDMTEKHPTPWFVQGSIGTDKKQVRDANGKPIDFTDFEIAGRVVHAVNVEARLMAAASKEAK